MHINEGEGKLALFSNVLLTPLSSYTSTINLVSLFSIIFPTSTSHRPYRHGVNVFGVNSVRPTLLTSSMCHVHCLQRILFLYSRIYYFASALAILKWRVKLGCSCTKAHIQYIKILTWLRGFSVKSANFSGPHCLSIPRRDLSTKKTNPNIEKMTGKPRSHVRILIYPTWAIL